MKTTFDEFENMLESEILTLRDKFMAVDENRVYFYNQLGGDKAEYVFRIKDLKELHFNATILTMKLVHYGREDSYETIESDLFVVFTSTQEFEKWQILFTPLVLKHINNDQILKGNLDIPHPLNWNLNRHVPINSRFVEQEDEDVADGHISYGDEEVNMKMLTKMTQKKKELDTVFPSKVNPNLNLE